MRSTVCRPPAWHNSRPTVGNGLVSQLPALVISTAAGMIVTRQPPRKPGLGRERVLMASPALTTTGELGGPGSIPACFLAPLFFGRIWVLGDVRIQNPGDPGEKSVKKPTGAKPKNSRSLEAARASSGRPTEIEFGLALLPLADPHQGGDLMDRIVMVRRQIASELGILIPFVRVRDNIAGMGPNVYSINLRGVDIGSGEVYPDRLMAMEGPAVSRKIQGIPGKEPAFGLDVIWIPKGSRDEAETAGYVIESSAVSRHLNSP